MRKYFLVFLAVVASACGTTYNQTPIEMPGSSLDPALKVAISVPADGAYGGRPYAGSGMMTADAVHAAFRKVGPAAEEIGRCDLATCLETARAEGFGYVVTPEILHWEDRATEWSGISDKVEIRLSVHDVSSGEMISAQVISGASSFWTLGGDHPQDLLQEPIAQYVRGLYS